MAPFPSLAAEAFVLGAGLGTRLRPLTDERPKPLIPIANKPLLTFVFDRLIEVGIEGFIVNTHHRPEAYAKAFPEASYRGRPIRWSHEPILLDTGGGIRKVGGWFGDRPFLVHNGDILTDLPIAEAVRQHLAGDDLATLVLRSGGPALHVGFDPMERKVVDIRGILGREDAPRFLYTGIAVLSPGFLRWIPEGGPVSLIPAFLDAIRRSGRVGGIVLDQGRWFDLGTREAYLSVHRELARDPGPWAPLCWIDPSARLAPDAVLEGATAIGPRCRVGSGALLRDSILWEDAEAAPGSRLERCVVRDSRLANGSLADADI
ncbi:Mannose-1-phosphate guanylyltransferase [Methylacidimicrobium sp. AP8]|uniref:sugar phosphate nucleotidyltransferase n=1 Tax=Methylacidimicrobium sp. AP8 TaxID=2730359 RepID=UPI0018C05C21|nr:sugar phosphate nucleotidyltransferase [Methylacidimicrobium sp. AP8]CAB4244013.1 Mannose-1-phosphate guanylyltransferase [Methylacidimicrobium sp. AP8]